MQENPKEVIDSELLHLLNDSALRFIDIRPVEAYNGWQLRGETRGGHIKNAKSLPFKWLSYMDWIEIVRFKEILPEHKVIIYGYEKEEIDQVAERFLKSGYNEIHVYYGFLDKWSVYQETMPMDNLERFSHLVSADWVNELIEGGSPVHYTNKRYKVVHAHYRNRDGYLSGHIPGAIDMDTLALEAPETWNRRSPDEIKEALERHGINEDTTVVLNGKFMFPDNTDEFPGSAAGDIGAIRNAFIMLFAGVKDVRILNGGFQSCEDAGYEISYTDEPKQPVNDFGAAIPARPELAVDTPETKEMIAAPGAEILCVRSYKEYIGEVSGYNYIEPKGRIPGAIFAGCGSDAYHMENYRNNDHTTRDYHEIEDVWKSNGITPDKHLAFYCGTGWRDSEAWFNAWLMG